jgi:hypothetical protein
MLEVLDSEKSGSIWVFDFPKLPAPFLKTTKIERTKRNTVNYLNYEKKSGAPVTNYAGMLPDF